MPSLPLFNKELTQNRDKKLTLVSVKRNFTFTKPKRYSLARGKSRLERYWLEREKEKQELWQ